MISYLEVFRCERINTAKQKDALTSFLMLNVLEAKIFQYGFLEGHNMCLLQNSHIFLRPWVMVNIRKVWSECHNGEEEWGEALKNTTVRHAYFKFVQSYPFFQQQKIPIGLILTQPVIKCHSHLIKKI